MRSLSSKPVPAHEEQKATNSTTAAHSIADIRYELFGAFTRQTAMSGNVSPGSELRLREKCGKLHVVRRANVMGQDQIEREMVHNQSELLEFHIDLASAHWPERRVNYKNLDVTIVRYRLVEQHGG